MLARNFMTAEDLGREQMEYDALVSVLGKLERGEIGHKNFDMSCPMRDLRVSKTYFNNDGLISSTITEDCGTAGCIGGYVAVEMGIEPKSYVYGNDNFYSYDDNDLSFREKGNQTAIGRLYFPRNRYNRMVDCIRSITPEEGAHALRNYLTTGEACWEEVLDGR